MPRQLSALAFQSALAGETGEAWLFLLEIAHPTLNVPLRWVNNTEEIVSRGEVYSPYPFDLNLSIDDEGHLPEMHMRVDNVDRSLMALVRISEVAPSITVRVVLGSQPDVVEVEIVGLSMLNVSYDAYQLDATLYADNLLNTRFPKDRISYAAGYIGLFKR